MNQIHRLSRDVKDLRVKSRRKFMRSFKEGFYDENYKSWERDFKWSAHERWQEVLNKKEFKRLLMERDYEEIAARALRVESNSALLFSYEEKALYDGLKTREGAELFSKGLYQYLYGTAPLEKRFKLWIETFEKLPFKTDSVLTWPVVTVFGFIARPETHGFLKSSTVKSAEENYGLRFKYYSKPNWEGYRDYLNLCEQVKIDLKDLKPRDMIDVDSFLSMQSSID